MHYNGSKEEEKEKIILFVEYTALPETDLERYGENCSEQQGIGHFVLALNVSSLLLYFLQNGPH